MRPGAEEELVAKHIEDVQKAIAEMNPDILVMQEIRNWDAAEKAVAKTLGLRVEITSQFQGAQQQVIATGFSVDSGWFAAWEETGQDDPPRGYAFAVIMLPGGQNLFLYTFHYKANSRGPLAPNIAKREEATRQMLAHAKDMARLYEVGGDYPVIFAGDFNTDSTDPQFGAERSINTIKEHGFQWVF